MKNPLIIKNITKFFGETSALNQLNFSLNQNEVFGLLGPNGAGKTTLISILTSLLKPTSGTASILGHDILKDSYNARRLIGVAPQEIVSHGFFTVNQVMKFHSGYYGLWHNQARIEYLLERLALTEHRHKLVAQLSGGMKRRFMIAKALVHSPPLLLLDEPTAGVDVELRNNLWEFVRELHQQGIVVLLTTHFLQEAEELCDRIGVLYQGQMIALDQTKNLIQRLTQRHVTLSLNQPWHGNHLPVNVLVNESTIRTQIPHNETVGELIQRLEIPLESLQDVSITEGNLEEAFVTLLNKIQEN